MDISSSYASTQYSASLAPLRAANEQPKLALQLILNTVQGIQSQGSAGTALQSNPAPAASPAASGQLIDIKA